MESKNSSEEDAPQQERPPADGKENSTKNRHRHPVPAADPHMEFVFAKVRNKGQKLCRVVMHGLPRQEPANVSPEAAIMRRVRIAFFVGVLVMHAMDGHPEDWAAFQS